MSIQNKPVRVLLADDAEVIRREVQALLEGDCKIDFVGAAANYSELLSMADELKPAVIVMDLYMPDLSKFAPDFIATHLLASAQHIIAISFSVDDEMKVFADRCGATAFLDKCELGSRLISAILECVHFKAC